MRTLSLFDQKNSMYIQKISENISGTVVPNMNARWSENCDYNLKLFIEIPIVCNFHKSYIPVEESVWEQHKIVLIWQWKYSIRTALLQLFNSISVPRQKWMYILFCTIIINNDDRFRGVKPFDLLNCTTSFSPNIIRD